MESPNPEYKVGNEYYYVPGYKIQEVTKPNFRWDLWADRGVIHRIEEDRIYIRFYSRHTGLLGETPQLTPARYLFNAAAVEYGLI